MKTWSAVICGAVIGAIVSYPFGVILVTEDSGLQRLDYQERQIFPFLIALSVAFYGALGGWIVNRYVVRRRQRAREIKEAEHIRQRRQEEAELLRQRRQEACYLRQSRIERLKSIAAKSSTEAATEDDIRLAIEIYLDKENITWGDCAIAFEFLRRSAHPTGIDFMKQAVQNGEFRFIEPLADNIGHDAFDLLLPKLTVCTMSERQLVVKTLSKLVVAADSSALLCLSEQGTKPQPLQSNRNFALAAVAARAVLQALLVRSATEMDLELLRAVSTLKDVYVPGYLQGYDVGPGGTDVAVIASGYKFDSGMLRGLARFELDRREGLEHREGEDPLHRSQTSS